MLRKDIVTKLTRRNESIKNAIDLIILGEHETETFALSDCLKRKIIALRENYSESDQGWKKSYK